MKLGSLENLNAYTATMCLLSSPALCSYFFSHVGLQFQRLCSKYLAALHWLLNNNDVLINKK